MKEARAKCDTGNRMGLVCKGFCVAWYWEHSFPLPNCSPLFLFYIVTLIPGLASAAANRIVPSREIDHNDGSTDGHGT